MNYIPAASVYNFNPVSDPPLGVNDVSYNSIIIIGETHCTIFLCIGCMVGCRLEY